MTDEEKRNYIKSYNLDIRTIEQIISFLDDREYCRIGYYEKREIVEYVYGNSFNEVWQDVLQEMKLRQRKMYNI